ncbi:MAG: cob(I)yrinic acid a,c-diamide adenosyltransferase [Bacillota bacterium]|nr:cob(I)yrinic acid a,c-diamide adenosyltransferase [Bacillota bacterium]
MKGLVHIYTGNGKGKTTAAIGLGIRAWGRNLKVLMVQFMKGLPTGEACTIEKLQPGFELRRGTEIKKFTWDMNKQELQELAQAEQAILAHTIKDVVQGDWDILILDEIVNSVSCGIIPLTDVLAFIEDKPEKLEVVMTGRNAPEELINAADYVTEMKEIKHPFNKGIPARKGIEC